MFYPKKVFGQLNAMITTILILNRGAQEQF